MLHYPQRKANHIRVKGENPKKSLKSYDPRLAPNGTGLSLKRSGLSYSICSVNLSQFLCASTPPFIYSWRFVDSVKVESYTNIHIGWVRREKGKGELLKP